MIVRFHTFSQFHNKIPPVGSTKIRVDNLIKYWDEAELYKYGEKPDVMIFQKIYILPNYQFIKHFPNIKILDICDPDWRDSTDIYIKETLDAVDAVVASSQNMTDYLQTMTKTKCVLIKDRFDLEDFPPFKKHHGELQTAVWFGYAHNAETLRFAIPSLETRKLKLLIISNEDPAVYRWANNPEEYKKYYQYIKYPSTDLEARKLIQQGDVAVFPQGIRPFDRFKSNNKAVIAQLCGLPVATNTDELDALIPGPARQKKASEVYKEVVIEYDAKKSVQKYKELIDEIKRTKAQS